MHSRLLGLSALAAGLLLLAMPPLGASAAGDEERDRMRELREQREQQQERIKQQQEQRQAQQERQDMQDQMSQQQMRQPARAGMPSMQEVNPAAADDPGMVQGADSSCSDGMVPIVKKSSLEVACVFESSYSILVERGWGSP